jgi:hypothetical protein
VLLYGVRTILWTLFCHYPGSTPQWNRVTKENRGHVKAVSLSLEGLEGPLLDLDAGRRALAGSLPTAHRRAS